MLYQYLLLNSTTNHMPHFTQEMEICNPPSRADYQRSQHNPETSNESRHYANDQSPIHALHVIHRLLLGLYQVLQLHNFWWVDLLKVCCPKSWSHWSPEVVCLMGLFQSNLCRTRWSLQCVIFRVKLLPPPSAMRLFLSWRCTRYISCPSWSGRWEDSPADSSDNDSKLGDLHSKRVSRKPVNPWIIPQQSN